MEGFHSVTTIAGNACGPAINPRGVLALCLLALAATSARADDSGDNGARAARFTGPLVSASPPLPKDLWNIEPYLIQSNATGYYDDDGHRHRTGTRTAWRLAVPVMYGLTDRLSLGATVNGVRGHGPDGRNGIALGDTTVSALYLLADSGGDHTPRLTAAIRQNLDTGRHDQLEQHRTSLATGSGAPTTTLALYGQAYFVDRTLRGRVNVSGRLPYSGVRVQGRSAYGTDAGFAGKVDLGSAFETTLGLECSLGAHWALALDIVYETEQGARVVGQTIDAAGHAVALHRDDPSSWRVSLAPAVEYHWNDDTGLIFGVFKSVAGRNAGEVFMPQVAINVVF